MPERSISQRDLDEIEIESDEEEEELEQGVGLSTRSRRNRRGASDSPAASRARNATNGIQNRGRERERERERERSRERFGSTNAADEARFYDDEEQRLDDDGEEDSDEDIEMLDYDTRTASASNSRRPIRIVPDWTENAVQGEHYWKPTSASGDLCCLNEECIKSGQRMKCSACQLVAHHNCIPFVNEKSTLACKPTYRDVGIRQYREQTTTHHHWVHRKLEKGKCKQCGKAVQSKLFGSKEIVALACAWCHEIYHNKEACFNQAKIGEECRLGNYAPIIVPPSWIVKLPTKGNFKSSIRVSNKNNAASGSGGGGAGGGAGGGGGGGGGGEGVVTR